MWLPVSLMIWFLSDNFPVTEHKSHDVFKRMQLGCLDGEDPFVNVKLRASSGKVSITTKFIIKGRKVGVGVRLVSSQITMSGLVSRDGCLMRSSHICRDALM